MSSETPADASTGDSSPPRSRGTSSSPQPESPDVYFGPFQSPEKKFLSVVARRQTLNSGQADLLLRHSPRLSAPPAADSSKDASTYEQLLDSLDESEEDESHPPRPSTPEIDAFPPDEPSSVLASRIIRAHDNPSPPPRHVELQNDASLLTSPFPHIFVDVPHVSVDYPGPSLVMPACSVQTTSGSQQTTDLGSISAFNFEFDIIPAPVFPSLTSLHGISESTTGNVSQHDLISFDSVDSPTLVHTPGRGPTEGHEVSRTAITAADTHRSTTVDDLLGRSPMALRAPSQPGPDRDFVTPIHSKSSPKSDHPFASPTKAHVEMGTAEYRTPLEPPPPPSSASIFAPNLSEYPVIYPASLRRSPRRSATPQPATPSDSVPQARKRRRNGKEKSLEPLNEIIEDREDSDQLEKVGEYKKEASGTVLSGELSSESESGMVKGKRRDVAPGIEGNDSDEHSFKRELGSLSPQSTNVLARLLPSLKGMAPPFAIPSVRDDILIPKTPPPPFTPAINEPWPSDPSLGLQGSIEHTSSIIVPSPTKATVGFSAFNDSIHTPRRVIMNPLSLSAQKASQPRAVRAPVFTKPMLDSPLQTPRRIPADHGTNPPLGQDSPCREPSIERDPSISTRLGDGPSGSAKPISTPSSFFPKAHRTTTMPAQVEVPTTSGPSVVPKRSGTQPSAIPRAKSSLRQHSPRTISRIPKPYARPLVAKKETKATAPVPMDVDSSTEVRSAVGIGGLAQFGSGSSLEDATTKPPLPSRRAQHVSVATGVTGPNSKRRIGTGRLSPPAMSRPMVVFRRVPPDPVIHKPLVSVKKTQHDPSPRKPVIGPPVIRRVPDMVVPKPISRAEADAHLLTDPSLGPLSKEPCVVSSPVPPRSQTPEVRSPPIPNSDDTPPSSPIRSDPLLALSRMPRLAPKVNAVFSFPVNDGPDVPEPVRRTTRARKPTQASDFVGMSEQRPPPVRRKPNLSAKPEAYTFGEMSAVALKALTCSNTVKNQQYAVVKLETEVVRREGARPESPAIKIRTISQKQMEEKIKERQARAERRARRGEDWPSDLEGSSEFGDSSFWDDDRETHDEEEQPLRHRRGPGDEDDYETPDRAGITKRLRLGGNETEAEVREKKRVKWDRGLSKTIYLDEVRPGERPRPAQNTIKKGCLAPTAKTLRLDMLGNIIDGDTPLGDLVHENIVVKKFVYDTDLQPQAMVPKVTRSRSKKVKT